MSCKNRERTAWVFSGLSVYRRYLLPYKGIRKRESGMDNGKTGHRENFLELKVMSKKEYNL